MEYLNSAISVVNLAKKDIGNMEERFASASDCLESWDDSYIIAVVNAHPRKQYIITGPDSSWL